MRGTFVSLSASLLAVCLIAGLAYAQDMGITVYTDKAIYVIGEDTLVMSVSGFNTGPDTVIDAHIAILAPGGAIYEIPDWNTEFRPFLPNAFLPSGFDFPQTDLGSYSVGDFPMNVPGSYYFCAAFTAPGTLEFVSDIYCALFEVQEGAADGWTAGGCQIMWDHWYDYDDDLEWETDVSAGGTFVKYPERPDFYIDYSALPIDTCEYVIYEPLADIPPEFQDAGDYIDMRGGPLGSYRMDKEEETNDFGITEISYGPGLGDELSESDYVVGSTYTFQGYGGPDVGAFEVSVVAPETLEVYTPDITSKPTINRSQPLNLSWNGVGEGYIQFVLGYVTIDIWTQNVAYHTCYCRFSDDGEATVPVSVLGQMPAFSDPFGLLDPPEMGIYRMNITDYTATGLQHGYGVALAGITRDVTIE